MTAPLNQIAVQGTTVATADYLNSLVQWVPDLVHLRQFIGVQGMAVILLGYVSQNDGGQGAYFWDTGSVAADDNINVIRPSGLTVGAWIRVTLTAEVVITSGVSSFNGRAGAVTLTSADVGATAPTFVSNVVINGAETTFGAVTYYSGLNIVGPADVGSGGGNYPGTTWCLGVGGNAVIVGDLTITGTVYGNTSGTAGATTFSGWSVNTQYGNVANTLWVGNIIPNVGLQVGAPGGIIQAGNYIQSLQDIYASRNIIASFGSATGGALYVGNTSGPVGDPSGFAVLDAVTGLQCHRVYTHGGIVYSHAGANSFFQVWDPNAKHLNFYVDTTFINFLPLLNSDARLKNVIGNYTGGVAVIKQIQPKQFTWNGAMDLAPADSTVHVGVVAQDLEALPGGPYPDLLSQGPGTINGTPVTDLRAVNPVQFVYPLINAVKELDARLTAINATAVADDVQTLQDEVATLQSQVATLQADMKTLQNQMKTLQAALQASRASKPAPPSPPKPGKKRR